MCTIVDSFFSHDMFVLISQFEARLIHVETKFGNFRFEWETQSTQQEHGLEFRAKRVKGLGGNNFL